MLDKRTDRLLKKLNDICKTGGFCVVGEGELLSDGEDGESVRGMLGYLKDRGYLDMQYADEGEYCVRILPEGRAYRERMRREYLDEAQKRKSLCCFSFIGSLLGALLGGAVILIISLLV